MTRRSTGRRGRGEGSTTIIGGIEIGMAGPEALVSTCLLSFHSLVSLLSSTSGFPPPLGFYPLAFYLAFVLRIAITVMSSHLLYCGVWEERASGEAIGRNQNGVFFLFIYLGSYSGRGECMLAGSMNDDLDDILAFEGIS